MGGMLGRMAAGFGKGVSSLATRFLNEEDAANRAKLLAELQHQNMVRADMYQNDPTRRGMLRDQAALDSTSAAAAQAAGQRAGVVAGQTDTAYQGALDTASERDSERERKRIESLTPAQVAAERAKAQAAADVQTQALKDRLPLEVQRAYATADASARASAKYREKPDTIEDKMARTEKVLGRALTEPEKLALIGLAKSGTGATEEIEVERDGDGKVVSSKTTTKGPAGARKSDAAPYADGTELLGKDGKRYVVQGGQPVLKEQAKPPAAPAAAPAARAPVDPKMQPVQRARDEVQAASAKFNSYGSAQRQRDPEGFARAQRELEAAKAALREAEGAYADSLGSSMIPSMRPTP